MRARIYLSFIVLLLCVSFLIPKSEAASNPWRELATRDLNAFYALIKENHPGYIDNENPDFRQWWKKGYDKALELAAKVNSLPGYYFALQFYANGFKDGHLGISWDLAYPTHSIRTAPVGKLSFPGIIAGWRNERIIVIGATDSLKQLYPLLVGSEVTACDSRPIREIIRGNVFQFYGDEKLPAHWRRFSPRVFLDEQNPFIKRPQHCNFHSANKQFSLDLAWQQFTEQDLPLYLVAAGAVTENENYAVKPFGNRHLVRVQVPSMDPTQSQKDTLNAIIEKLPTYKNYCGIVFDLRQNTGGNSWWGDALIASLWGKEYFDLLKSKLPSSVVDWRVSAGNVAKHEEILEKVIKPDAGENSDLYADYRELVRRMKEALRHGQDYLRWPQKADSKISPSKTAIAPIKARVFALTDGYCGSACLDFMDLLKTVGVVQIGQPTNADTMYMEVRGYSLPSGIAKYNGATKVYRQRLRRSGDYYKPDILWEGDIGDTGNIEKRIVKEVGAQCK